MPYGNSHGNAKGSRTIKPTLKKNKVGRLKLTEFNTYYKAIIKKTVWYWHLNGQINQ